VYFITLSFLISKIFTFYIIDVLLFKCPVPGPKQYMRLWYRYTQIWFRIDSGMSSSKYGIEFSSTVKEAEFLS